MKQYFCTGSYTEPILFGTGEVFRGKGTGIAICGFADGIIDIIAELPLRNPSFLCIDEEHRKIYTVNETKEYNGEAGGGITQVAYDTGGAMTVEAGFGTIGTDPCHIIQSPGKTFLSVANFAGGSVTVFGLDAFGSVNKNRRLHQHSGSSIHPVRQTGPHAHSTIFTPDGRYMLVPDLGLDQVIQYECGAGEVSKAGVLPVPPGSGPRFGEFSRDGGHFYLINEISSQVMHFHYKDGLFAPRNSVTTLPADYRGENICSDLHLSPDGRYLYAANRGHDSITGYKVQKDGSLRFLQRTSCRGKTPRNFAVDPAGEYLLAGNQDSDTISIFRIEADGCLTYTGSQAFGSPVCIRFFRQTVFT